MNGLVEVFFFGVLISPFCVVVIGEWVIRFRGEGVVCALDVLGEELFFEGIYTVEGFEKFFALLLRVLGLEIFVESLISGSSQVVRILLKVEVFLTFLVFENLGGFKVPGGLCVVRSARACDSP